MITIQNWHDYKNKRVWALHDEDKTKEPAILLHYDSNIQSYVLFDTDKKICVLSNNIKAISE